MTADIAGATGDKHGHGHTLCRRVIRQSASGLAKKIMRA
jgi:hypothetical protein